MSTIVEKLKEDISDSIENHIEAIKKNLEVLFGGLLYSLKLEMEKDGKIFVIDTLIDIIIDTTHYKYINDHTSIPCWDKENTKDLIEVLKVHLEKHGIRGQGV